MVTIDISIEDISDLIGLDKPLSPDELNEYLAFTIAEVDSDPEGPDENGHTKISVDIKTSNRPDLWSAEGIARILRGRQGEVGLPDLQNSLSEYEIDVEEGLKEIRPYIAAAVVRDLELSDFLIKQMIQIQDKIDFSFGRRRKRTSIGIYNINMLESPIKYKLVDREFKFQPLQFDKDLTIDQIFDQHPKGVEYRHILDDYELVPMLTDKNGLVLSMPPIINSDDVGRVTEETSDVLIEVTGTNYQATNTALSVIVQALKDRGGVVEAIKINYPKDWNLENEITPHAEPIEFVINPEDINKYLGTNYSKTKMIELIKTRRNDAHTIGKKISVKLPPWRQDVIHWVDLSEEIAIAADYNKFDPTDVQVVTPGKLHQSTDDENLVRQILVGLGLVEIHNYGLIDAETVALNIRRTSSWIEKACIEIANPVASTRSLLRPELLPGLIRFASRNTHVEYPHRIFETGESCRQLKSDSITYISAAALLAGSEESFETILSVLDGLFRLLGEDYILETLSSNYYIEGRSASIVSNKQIVGQIGEIHPEILNNYGIEVPMAAFEFDLTKISALKTLAMSTNKN